MSLALRFLSWCLLAYAGFLIFPLKGYALEIVTSIKPLQLITLALVLPDDDVDYIIPPYASPHTHSPTPAARQKLARADLLIWVGAELETRWRDLFRTKSSSIELLPLAQKKRNPAQNEEHTEHEEDSKHEEHTEHEEDSKHEEHGANPIHRGAVDTHIWMSPLLAEQAANLITARLAMMRPARAAAYRQRLTQFRRDLHVALAAINIELAPVRQRRFYVMHDAYGHFTDEFDLAVAGYVTLTPERPLSARHLRNIDREIAAGNIVCIFSEPQISPKIIKRLVRDRQVRYAVLDPLASAIKEDDRSYIRFLQELAAIVKECLG